MAYDIVFLHPPISFKKFHRPLSGVFDAQTGTTDFFLAMPVGLVNMAHQLRKAGYETVVYNVAELFKLQGPSFDLDGLLETLDARGFGIDLHWAVHAPGALEIARRVKALRPESFVFLGGLSASYFHEEILKDFPFVDGVVIGEYDERIVLLAEELQKSSPERRNIPNLAFLEGGGIVRNPVVLPEFSDFNFYNYYKVVEPRRGRMKNLMIPVIRGCTQSCPFCGGSKFSYKKFFHRQRPVALPPEKIAENIKHFARMGGESVNLLGDFRFAGPAYVDELLGLLRKVSHRVNIKSELFYLPDLEYLRSFSEAAPYLNLVLSPESVDPGVMKRLGKGYGPDDIRQLVKWSGDLKIELSLCFLYALPEQTPESIARTMDFIEEIQSIKGGMTDFMFEPMLFVDPGSRIFEEPEKWGFRIDFRTLKDIREGLERPHWLFGLGYETEWMSKNDILDAIFEVSARAAKLYYETRSIGPSAFQKTVENIEVNRRVAGELCAMRNPSDRDVEALVKRSFPPYLLEDNSLIKFS